MATVRRWWRAALIVLGFVVVAIFVWVSRRRQGVDTGMLDGVIAKAKDDLRDNRTRAAIEIEAARRREVDVKDRVKDVMRLQDRERRQQELLAIYREVSR